MTLYIRATQIIRFTSYASSIVSHPRRSLFLWWYGIRTHYRRGTWARDAITSETGAKSYHPTTLVGISSATGHGLRSNGWPRRGGANDSYAKREFPLEAKSIFRQPWTIIHPPHPSVHTRQVGNACRVIILQNPAEEPLHMFSVVDMTCFRQPKKSLNNTVYSSSA